MPENNRSKSDAGRPDANSSSFAGHFLPGERNVPPHQRIYTSRNLRMEHIKAIGFDMDHTLALYERESFEQLTFDLSVEFLIRELDYPSTLREISYQPDFILRGLVVDKKFGNLLKMDAHGYVAASTHGTKRMSKAARDSRYRNRRVNFRGERFQSFDTLFSMPEGALFAALIDLKAEDADGLMERFVIEQIFDNVRHAVDSIHGDGSLKKVIMGDLGKYFVSDPDLRATLLRFRALGKKLFLLTNSEHHYTEAVMGHLLSQNGSDWKDLFDLVIVESRKPGFFMKREAAEVIEVESEQHKGPFFYRGGNAPFFEKALGAQGDEVLYFGDHTYGDILRSKKTVGWRTAMIVFELEREIRIQERRAHLSRELSDLISRNQDLSRDRDQLRLLAKTMAEFMSAEADTALPEWARGFLARELRDFLLLSPEARGGRMSGLEQTLKGLDFLFSQTEARIEILHTHVRDSYNPHWGALFREGNELSRFARQVMEFSCIYTSRVANFLNYPGDFYFISPVQKMPHE